jgi:uncharacterized protein
MSEARSLVLYHANCADGFASAWVAHRKLGDDADYVPVQYGEDPPDVAGREVYVLDFSFKRSVLLEMARSFRRLVLLDHHKTAAEDLAPFVQKPGQPRTVPGNWHVVFDMEKSGARLAWEYFFPREEAPWLVRFVEDRDLWRWRLDRSREVSAALASLPHDFAVWDRVAWAGVGDMVGDGEAILRYQRQQVESICANAREVELDGHKVLAANTPCLISEVAGKLAEGRPFGAAWFVRSDGKRQWSLRSRDGGVDVSEVARRRGGGGHRNAAGFEEAGGA